MSFHLRRSLPMVLRPDEKRGGRAFGEGIDVYERPTEECPLTKGKSYKYTLSTYCGDGLKFIISCFTILTISITTTLVLQILYADGTLQDKAGVHGAVATDYTNCSQIGTRMLRKGGNAIDAAVAATICMAVVAPHKTGLGGGGYVMMYNHKERTNPVIVDFASNTIKDSFDGVRVPAVLRGLERAHSLKGRLSWSNVVEPSASLAKGGFVVSKELATQVSKSVDYEILYGHLSAGDTLKLNDLAATLDAVASQGTNVLYNGSSAETLLHDKLLFPRLENYEPDVYEAKRSSFYEHAVYYPAHVSLLESMIDALENLGISSETASTIGTQIQVAEALMNSSLLSLRMKRYVDKERYTQVTAMDWDDTYVCIITGLGAPFGLGYMSGAGFLLDEANDDNNFSTFLPIIFHDERTSCGLRGVFGTDDVLIAGQLLYNIILRRLNVSEAVEYPRYYFSSDGLLAVENDEKHSLDALVRDRLTFPAVVNSDSKSVNAIIKRRDLMSSHSDSRGGGLASRF
ncbi:glutathione hydrolase 7-like isoform X2 [Ceratina calcarata]|uniref:Glutathione hydrolase 7-like isoform X2 n=1 Tax=Ceratina calcarata TaxID=156304 RepID=A0AAJ7SA11_9HYME|nr:glutathione hydrolase 7-like isoform X2 [Ceratina calcarata]